MIQPIVMSQVAQIMHEEYGLEPVAAVDAAIKLLKRLERHNLQVIRGEWVIPEPVAPKRGPVVGTGGDRWVELAEQHSAERIERETGRTPWKP